MNFPGIDRPYPPRSIYQGIKQPNYLALDVGCGESGRIRTTAGSVVSITNLDGCPGVWLTALSDGDRNFGLSALELPKMKSPPPESGTFDCRMMEELAKGRGATFKDASFHRIFDDDSEPGELFVLRTRRDTDLFLVVPAEQGYLWRGGGGKISVRVKQPVAITDGNMLPRPLGKVRDEWRVATGTAKAYEVRKGECIQIIDVEGQQCSDFMAMRSDALASGIERHIDSTVSRTMTRSAYPAPGLLDKFFDQDIRPLLAVRHDTVGRHDTFALACTARGYEERGFPGHLNCSDNISEAYAPFGIQRRRAWPAINFFFNSWIDRADNIVASDEAWSRPGDYVALEALTDLVCVSTACPDDIDPINGWNPTDIHVRVYEEGTKISHAVSWRAQPDDAQQLTVNSPFHTRTSALTSSFRAAKECWLPAQFDATGAIEEYWACRQKVTVQDMSVLRKFDVVGPDANDLLQHCLTRDVSKLSQHRGFYALMCDNRGSVLDDGTLFRLEQNAYRWFCGSDNSALHLREAIDRLGLNARVLTVGAKMANLAVQGPKSRELLRKIVFTQPVRPALDNLKWFGFTIARLRDREGPMFMLCRSGFTGELGYELFCDRNDALEIWDGVMEAGSEFGVVPMGGDALEILRIEAGLMSAGAEFCADVDALEAGLGFAVDFGKSDFIGKAALVRNSAAPRRQLVGLHIPGNEAPMHGDPVFVGREQVGVVTSGCVSPLLGHAIAMARVATEDAAIGNKLEVGKLDGHMKRLVATVTSLPFVDPERRRARA